jgi:hypothetical protein
MDIPLPILATYFVTRESQVVVPVGSYVPLISNNGNRWSVLFCSVTGGQVNLVRNQNLPLSGSLTLANAANASEQFILLAFKELGPAVQEAWFGTSGTGVAETVGITEVIYQPPGG